MPESYYQQLDQAGRCLSDSKFGVAYRAQAPYIGRVSSHDRRVGMPPRNRSEIADVRRCSIRSRRAAGAFGRGTDAEPAARRGRPVQIAR
jgi:hypothetical protein